MSPGDKRILTVTCFGHFMSHFNMLVFPAVALPLAERLGIDLAAALGLSFWQYLLFGVTALPWGAAIDRLGAKPFMILFFFGAGVSGAAAAFYIDSPLGLTLSLAGIGLFSGIYHPAGLGMITKGMERLSMGLGVNGIFGNIGLAAAPFIAGTANRFWGPAGAYAVLAAFNFIGCGLSLFMNFEESAVETKAEEKTGASDGIVPFLILLVAMMLGGVAYRGATVITPAFFELNGQGILEFLARFWEGGVSANLAAAGLTSFIYLIGILGQFSGGVAGEKYDAGKAYLFFHALTLPPILLMGLAGNWTLVGLSAVYFFFLLGMQPVENTLVARLTPRRFHHSAFGAKFVFTFGVGSLAVKMVGTIEHNWGIVAVFPALGAVSAVLVLTIILLRAKTGPIPPKGAVRKTED